MAKNKQMPKREKHVPKRTCVTCRTSRPKRNLVRIVRTPQGDIVIDETGKQNGRGAYLCRQQSCWEQAIKRGALSRALRVTLDAAQLVTLQAYAKNMPASLTMYNEEDVAR